MVKLNSLSSVTTTLPLSLQPMRLTQRRQSFVKKRNSMITNALPNKRGFAEIHPSGRLRRVLVLYTGGTIGMMPSSRGYVCKSGYLPKLLESLPMFHDPDFDLSSEDLPRMATSTSSSSSTPSSPSSPTMRTAANYNEDADAATPTR